MVYRCISENLLFPSAQQLSGGISRQDNDPMHKEKKINQKRFLRKNVRTIQ